MDFVCRIYDMKYGVPTESTEQETGIEFPDDESSTGKYHKTGTEF